MFFNNFVLIDFVIFSKVLCVNIDFLRETVLTKFFIGVFIPVDTSLSDTLKISVHVDYNTKEIVNNASITLC